MLIELLLFLASASQASIASPAAGADPLVVSAPAQQADIGVALVDRLVQVCARHPEVERAFLLVRPGENGKPEYMFIPIFDRKVSNEVLSEAQLAYRELAPGQGGLPLALLARNSWKKTLSGVPPIYVRPKK